MTANTAERCGRVVGALLLCLVGLAAGASARATTFTWTATAGGPLEDGGGTWDPTGGTNWFDGAAYGAWGNTTADLAIFGVGSGAAGTVTVGSVTANGLQFDAPGSGSYTLSGGTITLGGTTPTIAVATGLAPTIGSLLAGSSGVTKAGAGTLVLTAANTYSGGTTITSGTLQVGAGGATGSLGSGDVVVQSGATLAYDLSAATGVTLPAGSALTGAGSLSFAAGGASLGTTTLGGSMSLAQRGGGSLYNGFAISQANVTLSAATIALSGDVGTRDANGNTLTLDTSAANGTIDLSISLGRSGVWYVPTSFTANAGTGAINVTGTGQASSGWRLTPVTLRGAVNIQSAVDSAAAVVIDATADGSAAGAFSGAMPLTKQGSGTLTLTGASTHTGTTTISAGTLRIGAGGTTGSIGSGSSIVVSAGGRLALDYGSAATLSMRTSSSLSGAGDLTAAAGVIQLNGNLAMGGSQSYTQIGGGTIYTGIEAVAASTTLAASAISLAGDVGKRTSAGNAITLDTTATDGPITLDISLGRSGVWYPLTAFTANAGTGSITVSGSRATNGWEGGTVTLAGGVAISANVAGGAPLTINATAPGTVSGVLSGAKSLTKSGPETLTLSAANTYTGGTTISAGTLRLQSTNASPTYAIAAGGVLELDAASGSRSYAAMTFSGSGTLRKTGGNQVAWGGAVGTFALASGGLIDVQAGTFTGGSNGNEVWTTNRADLNVAGGATFTGVEANVRVDALTGSGTISSGYSGAGYASFTFGVDDGSGTFSGTLADAAAAGSFTKVGTGTQTLTGTGTYTGLTTVAGGTLAITNNAAIGAATGNKPVTIRGGGRLSADWSTAQSTNLAAVTLGGAGDAGGELAATGVASATLGHYLLNGNVTVSGASRSVISADVRVNNNATRTFDVAATGDPSGTDLLLSGKLGHANGSTWGYMAKAGAGVMTITGPNEIGGTTVSAGRLVLENAGLAGSANTGFTNSATAELRVTTGTIDYTTTRGGELKGSGLYEKTGPGTLVVSRANTLSGTFAVVGGTLRAGSASGFGTGTLSIGVGGTLDLNGLALANAITNAGGTLTNASAYAGTQSVTGTALMSGTIGGGVSVATGGILKGSGTTFTGAVGIASGGTHAPGTSPGTQTFSGGLSYAAGSTLVWELAGNTTSGRGTAYDAIDVTGGALVIDPAATFSLDAGTGVLWDDAFWNDPRSWTAIDVAAPGTWNGTVFGLLTTGNDSLGRSLAAVRPDASFSLVATGGDLTLEYVAVPEPASLGVAALVIGGLLAALPRPRSRRPGG